MLKPRDLSNLINTIKLERDAPDISSLDFVTTTLMEAIRDSIPDALPIKPLEIGKQGPRLPVTSSALSRLLQLAAVTDSDDLENVIWDDGINQLLVRPAKIKAVVTTGQVRIDIPVAADGFKATTMQVPFGIGSEERQAGLVASTLSRPAGNPVIARIWGDALVALAYSALMSAANSITGAAGRDIKNDRLIPRAFVAKRGQLTIESQARFRFKRLR